MNHITSLSSFPNNSIIMALPMSDRYPTITFANDHLSKLQSQRRTDRPEGAVLVPVTEPLSKRIISTFMERGLLAALCEATQSESRSLVSVAVYFLSLGNRISALWSSVPTESTINLLAKHSQTRNWRKSVIRSLAWHPHYFKLAVATVDDTVCIYTLDATTTPILKAELQKSIACLAWRPNSAGELAIGCESGLLIWSINPTSEISRPIKQALHLKHGRSKHRPVSSVSWNASGELLVTASISDACLFLWNVDQQRCVPLHKFGPPCAMACFGSAGRQLLATTVGKEFCISDMPDARYNRTRWTTARGSLQSFVWSQDEKHLLFVTTEDQELFHTRHARFNTLDYEMGCAIVDLTRRQIEDGSTFGGLPQSIAWCPKNRYLAIAFKDTSAVAIFITCLNGFEFSIDPSCYINGVGLEYPCCMQFQQNYQPASSEVAQSILTVGWSSGRIAYYPLK